MTYETVVDQIYKNTSGYYIDQCEVKVEFSAVDFQTGNMVFLICESMEESDGNKPKHPIRYYMVYGFSENEVLTVGSSRYQKAVMEFPDAGELCFKNIGFMEQRARMNTMTRYLSSITADYIQQGSLQCHGYHELLQEMRKNAGNQFTFDFLTCFLHDHDIYDQSNTIATKKEMDREKDKQDHGSAKLAENDHHDNKESYATIKISDHGTERLQEQKTERGGRETCRILIACIVMGILGIITAILCFETDLPWQLLGIFNI